MGRLRSTFRERRQLAFLALVAPPPPHPRGESPNRGSVEPSIDTPTTSIIYDPLFDLQAAWGSAAREEYLTGSVTWPVSCAHTRKPRRTKLIIRYRLRSRDKRKWVCARPRMFPKEHFQSRTHHVRCIFWDAFEKFWDVFCIAHPAQIRHVDVLYNQFGEESQKCLPFYFWNSWKENLWSGCTWAPRALMLRGPEHCLLVHTAVCRSPPGVYVGASRLLYY